jgi:hypothetical protein
MSAPSIVYSATLYADSFSRVSAKQLKRRIRYALRKQWSQVSGVSDVPPSLEHDYFVWQVEVKATFNKSRIRDFICTYAEDFLPDTILMMQEFMQDVYTTVEGLLHAKKAHRLYAKKFRMVRAVEAHDTCPICCDDLSSCCMETDLISCPMCRNQFHGSCADAWCKIKPSCPTCRSDVWRSKP